MANEKEFRVGVWHTTCGSIFVEAENEEEAIKKANNLLDEEGESAITKVSDREFEAVGVDF